MKELVELVEGLQSLVARASQRLGPADTLNPILAVVVEEEIKYRVIDPTAFSSEHGIALYQVIPSLIRQIEPDLAAMVIPLHFYQVDDLKSEENWDRFKKALHGQMDETETIEGILIAAYSRDEESLWVSEVTRFAEEPPLIGVWNTLPEQVYSETIDALRRGMFVDQNDV